MDFTPNLNLPIPNPDAVPPKNISDQFPDIAIALTMLDTIIHSLQGVVAGKAETNHSQAMSTITGLVDALAAKMPANTTFSLDDLEDVMGAADALVNYVLVKNASGFWVPSTALAALGVHNHAISEVVGLAAVLDDLAVSVAALSSGKANKAVTVTGAGLASGGGDLSANRVITVTKATDAEATARTRDDVAATPRGMGLAIAAYNRFETIRDLDLAGVTAVNIPDLSAFRILHITGSMKPSVNGAFLWAQGSVDNGATWLSGIYTNHFFRAVETSTGAGLSGAETGFYIAADVSNAWESAFDHTFTNFNKVGSKYKGGWMAYVSSAGNNTGGLVIGRTGTSNSAAWNALRFFISSGTISVGSLHVEGIRG